MNRFLGARVGSAGQNVISTVFLRFVADLLMEDLSAAKGGVQLELHGKGRVVFRRIETRVGRPACEPVDVRCSCLRVPAEAADPVAQIIDDNHQHIRWLGGILRTAGDGQGDQGRRIERVRFI